jgi:sugar-specific transcriptional regulator TrmB
MEPTIPKEAKESARDSIPEAAKEALRSIGLTEYEIAIYLTLIVHGPMNARDLSDKSGVPYSRIYNILQMLEEKSFILKEEESRPSRYFAKSPDESLVIARKRNKNSFESSAEIIINELTPIYKRQDAPLKISLYVIRGKETCFERVIRLMDATENSFYIASGDMELLQEVLPKLKELRARGVRNLRVLIEERFLEDAKYKDVLHDLKKVATVRARDQLFGAGIVKDEGDDAFLVLSRMFFQKKSFFGIVTDHLAFGPAAMDYFNYLYETAKKLE